MEQHTHDVSEITRPISNGLNPARLLGLVVAVGLVRAVAMRKARRGGGFGPMRDWPAGRSRWAGRGEAVAEFHRQLHARDAQAAPADEAAASA